MAAAGPRRSRAGVVQKGGRREGGGSEELAGLFKRTCFQSQNLGLECRSHQETLRKTASLLSQAIDAKFRGLADQLAQLSQQLKQSLTSAVETASGQLKRLSGAFRGLETASFFLAREFVQTAVPRGQVNEIAASLAQFRTQVDELPPARVPEFEFRFDTQAFRTLLRDSVGLSLIGERKIDAAPLRETLAATLSALTSPTDSARLHSPLPLTKAAPHWADPLPSTLAELKKKLLAGASKTLGACTPEGKTNVPNPVDASPSRYQETDDLPRPLIKHSVKIDHHGNFSEGNQMNVVDEESVEEEAISPRDGELEELLRPSNCFASNLTPTFHHSPLTSKPKREDPEPKAADPLLEANSSSVVLSSVEQDKPRRNLYIDLDLLLKPFSNSLSDENASQNFATELKRESSRLPKLSQQSSSSNCQSLKKIQQPSIGTKPSESKNVPVTITSDFGSHGKEEEKENISLLGLECDEVLLDLNCIK